jgi:hypothetical protein
MAVRTPDCVTAPSLEEAELLAPVYARFTKGFFIPRLWETEALFDGTGQTR